MPSGEDYDDGTRPTLRIAAAFVIVPTALALMVPEGRSLRS